MKKAIEARWLVFAFAAAISLYVSIAGTVFMGFCSGLGCWPHMFAWILLTPCLLLAIWSLRAAAIAAVLLLVAHVYMDVHKFGGGLNADTLWGTDMALDICFWGAVFLLVLAASLPKRIAIQRD
jgi:hypothetical protein